LAYESWNKFYVPLYTCLEDNKCQIRGPDYLLDGRDTPPTTAGGTQVGYQSCGYQHCKQHLLNFPHTNGGASHRGGAPWNSVGFSVVPTRPNTLTRLKTNNPVTCDSVDKMPAGLTVAASSGISITSSFTIIIACFVALFTLL
jgi:hypothetical protein